MVESDTKSVLVVSEDAVDTAIIESSLSEASVSLLPDLSRLFDELTTAEHHCLVLRATYDGQSGTDIARGVRKLFPELSILVTGVGPSTVPADLDVTPVGSAELTGEAVTAAIREALGGPTPSVAGRPPSPMETLLLSLFNHLPDHLYAKDESARHVLVGRGISEPTDWLGLTDLEMSVVPAEHGEAAYRDDMKLIERDTDLIDVEEFLDLDQTYVRTCKVPWYGADGEIQGVVGHTRDVTERRRREHTYRRQHERMVKVALMAAHEFRNELQIAHGSLEQIDADESTVAGLDASLSRISSLVDTVVELSQSERAVRDYRPVWLSRLSREVWDVLADESSTIEIADDARVLADQESAGLLLQFLFRNAIDHAGPGVTVTVGTTADGFYVADDGPGIDVQPPDRIFDAGYTTVDGNTGFGLYVARMVAADHDWDLAVSNDDGARFDIGNVELAE